MQQHVNRLVLLGLMTAILVTIGAQMSDHVALSSAAEYRLSSPLPPESPLPPDSPVSPGDNPPGDSNFAGNDFVELLYSVDGRFLLRFRTLQANVGWWDACGRLALAPSINGFVEIPIEAQETSIPGDVPGRFNLSGLTKVQKPSGEWILKVNSPRCACVNEVAVCQ